MSILIPEPTPYDVNFRLLDFPIRVHPGFWVVHFGIAGFLANDTNIAETLNPVIVFLISFICTSGSILLHELGHVLAGRKFGADGEVVLTFLGGFAGTGIEAHGRKHRILTILAGPAMNVLLVAVAAAGYEASQPSVEEIISAYRSDPNAPLTKLGFGRSLVEQFTLMLLCINIPLVLFNLLPIPPLDGGLVLQEIVEWYRFGDRPEWERDANWWKRG